MNYYDTFIEVAEDCPASIAEVPQPKGDKKTKAILEYEMIANHPYKYTEEDIAFETYALANDLPKTVWPEERERFFSKGQPCLRASALAKRYGWGFHNDTNGKVAMVAVESTEYKKFANDPTLAHTKALRSKRA